jgi:hypothetical protein
MNDIGFPSNSAPVAALYYRIAQRWRTQIAASQNADMFADHDVIATARLAPEAEAH